VKLSKAQADRAAGVLLATACGDALGAGYEFAPPVGDDVTVGMVGGGTFGWAPGEWTDDTSMAIPIAELAATGADLRDEGVLGDLVGDWVRWAGEAPDVGAQTSAVLFGLAGAPSAAAARASAAGVHRRTGRSAGNGSLMRTAPVALAYLDDPAALADAAMAVSELTHHDRTAGEACVIWCLAIRHAVLHGTFGGVRLGVASLPADRAQYWSDRLDEAEALPPTAFTKNGWVVQALQAAWSAISRTPVPADDPDAGTHPAQHLALALEAAVRGGYDTDTVAAIAGGLLGARWGASAVPAQWRRAVHGWPFASGRGSRARYLTDLAALIVDGGAKRGKWPNVPVMDNTGWPGTDTLVRHPHDSGVWLSGADALRKPPAGVDAAVSMCRIGRKERPARITSGDHVEVWLLDEPDPADNPNLDFVLVDAADAVAALRAREARCCCTASPRTRGRPRSRRSTPTGTGGSRWTRRSTRCATPSRRRIPTPGSATRWSGSRADLRRRPAARVGAPRPGRGTPQPGHAPTLRTTCEVTRSCAVSTVGLPACPTRGLRSWRSAGTRKRGGPATPESGRSS
jgi:ADP-ribosylglycohydrolase